MLFGEFCTYMMASMNLISEEDKKAYDQNIEHFESMLHDHKIQDLAPMVRK